MKNVSHVIDCKGLNCPLPVINTKKYFDGIKNGVGIIVVDNEVAKNNVVKFATSNGYEYEVNNQGDNVFEVTIVKGEAVSSLEVVQQVEASSKPLTIVVGSDKLGEGSDDLGTALMKSYLFALSEADVIPDNLLFLNGGVKLVIEGSLALESIKKLNERGVNIQSCGLCLDFYGIKEKLAVGEITNMYAIVEMMNKSNTIKL